MSNRNIWSTMTHLLILLVILLQYSTTRTYATALIDGDGIGGGDPDEKSLLSVLIEKEIESRPTQPLVPSPSSSSSSLSAAASSNEEVEGDDNTNTNLFKAVMVGLNDDDNININNNNKYDDDYDKEVQQQQEKTLRRHRYYLAAPTPSSDPTRDGPLQRKSAKKRFKLDRNMQRVEKKSWNLPTQTLGHYLDIKEQAKQTARKAHELRKLLNSINDI